jgi:hypothetical protein
MDRIHASLLMVIVLASSAYSYRFICNGILANGEVRSDECGICDEEHAARWKSPNLEVVVDENILPAGITKNEWRTVVKNSFAAWENISGSRLKFTQLKNDNLRQLGATDSMHEIFWITDKNEWRKMVGAGEFGTLGATLPRYVCGGSMGEKRSIFDADLVLNGLPHINWKLDCHDDECISIQTTLVHELGHFFGLDHPCLMCGNSIMSARAGFNLMYPVFDDMEGVRALYPSDKKGGFGFPCNKDSECGERNHCISDKLIKYCSTTCNDDKECALGAVCGNNDGSKACVFVDSQDVGGRKEGDNCMRGPCSEPMICAGVSEPHYFCYNPCKNDTHCKPGQACVDIEDGEAICVTIKHKGERCNHRELCEEELYCVFDRPRSGYCRAPCKPTDLSKTGCGHGEVCEIFDNVVEICVPKEEVLALDVGSDGFAAEKNNSFEQEKNPPTSTPQGCQSNQVDNAHDISWLILVFLWWCIHNALMRNRKVCPV